MARWESAHEHGVSARSTGGYLDRHDLEHAKSDVRIEDSVDTAN